MFNGFVGGVARFYTKIVIPVEFHHATPKGFIRTSESKKGIFLNRGREALPPGRTFPVRFRRTKGFFKN
jgi:hypothetical protein